MGCQESTQMQKKTDKQILEKKICLAKERPDDIFDLSGNVLKLHLVYL